MNTLTKIIDKLGELILEAEALLMEIRVIQFDIASVWRAQFVAMSCVGLLLGTVAGWVSIVHIFAPWR